jgi:acyl-CoA thioesterase-1
MPSFHSVHWFARLRAIVVHAAAACVLLVAAGAVRAAPDERVILVMGDSLAAGYGLAADQGWVSLLATRVTREHPGWRVINASISGETTAGGAARIAAELARVKPAVVVIELGANDGLRGLPVAQAQDNLARMARAASDAGAKVLLIGMRIPPNYGPDYTEAFAAMYGAVAGQFQAALLPFLLEPIARDRDAFQADNLHPVAAVQGQLLDHVYPALRPLLD